jgi:glycosyltransferase involved in cell wall biosynthesis
MVLARVTRRLLAAGIDVHALIIGEGAQRMAIKQMLGRHSTLPGYVEQEKLPWLYASSDIFVFPSRIETYGNAVIEAKSCGLPVVVARETAPAVLSLDGRDGLVCDADDGYWYGAVRRLCLDRGLREGMGRAARHDVVVNRPDWDTVLEQDLIPAWTHVFAGRSRTRVVYVRQENPVTGRAP